jgi:tetratricopeptide (TPR) repeat protein
MGLFGRKPQYTIHGLLREEQAKLDALYNLEVYPVIGGPQAPLSNIHDQQKVSWTAAQALERAVVREPYEFLWHLALGEHYVRLGRFADAVMVNERALALHPNDPRAEYAMATCLRMLTRAAYSGREVGEMVVRMNKMIEGTEPERFLAGGKFDPYQATYELQKLGLTWEYAARKSVKHFKKAIASGLSASETKFINTIIESMREEFLPFSVTI